MSSLGLRQQQANRESDAAILGVACASVETGSGVIRNYYNVRAPGARECVPTTGRATVAHPAASSSSRTAEGHRPAADEPKQAAGMFFDHLARMVPNWRNMEPGSAIQAVQRSAFPTALPVAQIPWATIQVKAARTAKRRHQRSHAGHVGRKPAGCCPIGKLQIWFQGSQSVAWFAGSGSRVGKPVPDLRAQSTGL